MIDLNHLEQYRENNRIEAKRALGGLPHSIWAPAPRGAEPLSAMMVQRTVSRPSAISRFRREKIASIESPLSFLAIIPRRGGGGKRFSAGCFLWGGGV